MQYKMHPKEYFRKLIELYFDAREPRYYNPNIFRGRSSSVSSDLEDLTALFIALNNPNSCNYFTDQPIRFEGDTTKYPDIVIQNDDAEGTIENLVDTKADTGWNRDGMFDFCNEWEKRIDAVKGKSTSFLNGKTKENHNGKFSKDLHYHVLVITQENSGKKLLEDHKKINDTCKNVSLYILSSGMHPNNYDSSQGEVLDNININDDEFDRLISHITKQPTNAALDQQLALSQLLMDENVEVLSKLAQ